MFATAAAGLLDRSGGQPHRPRRQDSRAAALQNAARRKGEAPRAVRARPSSKSSVLKARTDGFERLIFAAQRVLRRLRLHRQAGRRRASAFGGGWRHDLFERQARVVLEAGGSLPATIRCTGGLLAAAAGARRTLELGVEGVYRSTPQDDFYGLGPDTTVEDNVSAISSRATRSRDAPSSAAAWLQRRHATR